MHTAVLVGMGGALLLLSLCSDGALGAWPWIGRRLHRVLDLVAAAVLAASPLLLSLDSVLPIVILEAAALGMVWLAVRTNWVARRPRSVLAAPSRGTQGARATRRAAHLRPPPTGTAPRPQAGFRRWARPGPTVPASSAVSSAGRATRGAGGHPAIDRSPRRTLRPRPPTPPNPPQALPRPAPPLRRNRSRADRAHRRPRGCVPWGWWCLCGRWGGFAP